MNNKYFGTDGIRGTVNKGNITGKNFLNLVWLLEPILKIKRKQSR